MTVLLTLIGYVINIFLNRWLNYIIYKYQNGDILPISWFLSLISTFIFILMIISNLFIKSDWFNGEHWKDETK